MGVLAWVTVCKGLLILAISRTLLFPKGPLLPPKYVPTKSWLQFPAVVVGVGECTEILLKVVIYMM